PVSAPESSKAATAPPLINQTPPEKSSTFPVKELSREIPAGVDPLITNEPLVATKASDSSSAPPSQNSATSTNAAAQQPLVASTTASAPSPPAESDSHKPAASAATDSARNSESETPKQPGSVSPSSSVPLVAIAPKLFFDRSTVLALATAVVAVVLVLVWIWLRRSRSTRHVSLITRSLDHETP